MVELQELIIRGRMILNGADKRLQVFELVNGKISGKEIARKTGRLLPSVDKDLEKLRDMELIKEMKDDTGRVIKKEGSIIYEKNPVIKHVPISYFSDVADTKKLVVEAKRGKAKQSRVTSIHVPSETEILDLCKSGEDQLYEFKAPGVDTEKITREVSGMLNTRGGGILFYGISDDGAIVGSDLRRQDFDQRIQNSVHNTISPQPTIKVHERNVMGSKVLLVVIPPWDRTKRTVFQNTKDGKYYVRKGTNIFVLRPDEMHKLHQGIFVA
jgi:DNA-binding transcriptional ArsR family regulator